MTTPTCPFAAKAAQSAAEPVTALLKRETQANHDSAERHPLQKQLASGQLPIALYADYLAQLRVVHSALETRLSKLGAGGTVWASALAPAFRHVDAIDADVTPIAQRTGGSAASNAITPHAAALARDIASDSATTPAHVLGMVYVLEGSMNGGRFIARVVRRAYGFDSAAGTGYMDPYGDEMPVRWAAFKTGLDSGAQSASERQAALDGAKRMFDAIARIGDELLAAQPAHA